MTESNEMCHDNSNKEWKPTHAETRCRSLHLLPPKKPPLTPPPMSSSQSTSREMQSARHSRQRKQLAHTWQKKKIQKRMKKLKKEAHRMPARMNLLRKSEFMK